jgi:hypothetical protein
MQASLLESLSVIDQSPEHTDKWVNTQKLRP